MIHKHDYNIIKNNSHSSLTANAKSRACWIIETNRTEILKSITKELNEYKKVLIIIIYKTCIKNI